MRYAFPFVLVTASAGTLAAGDWPEWRGPARNGLVERSPALVSSFSGQSPTWQSETIPGGDVGGRGSLVVHKGRVYAFVSVASKSDEVFCLDAESGKTVWKAKLSGPGSDSGSSTPCIAGEKLYVMGSGFRLHCLNLDKGTLAWEADLPRTESRAAASSVAVVGKTAVVLADVLTGVDAGTGAVRWTQPRITGHDSSPARWSSRNGDYVICNTTRETLCVDPADGKVLWSVPGGGKSTPVIAQEYGGDFLINMSDGRRNGLTAYRLTDKKPKALWTLEAFDRGASPVVFDGNVYAIAGGGAGHGARLLCVHLDTGKVAWDERIDFAEVSSPVIADGKMFAVCGTFLWVLQASPERYSVLSQADCRITLCTSPALADGRLYVRQANAVVCYDLRTTR